MVIENEIELFGIERITVEEFNRWKNKIAENAFRTILPRTEIPGFEGQAVTNGLMERYAQRTINEGLTAGPENLGNFYFQAFLQYHRDHFQFLDEVSQKLGFFASSDLISMVDYFDKAPDAMGFKDYVRFAALLMDKNSDNIVGDLNTLNFGFEWNRDTYGSFEKRNVEFEFRVGGPYGDKLFYFNIDPKSQTSSIFYRALLMQGKFYDKDATRLKEVFESSDSPYKKYDTLSFIAPFAGMLLPFVNVREVTLIHGYNHENGGSWDGKNRAPAFNATTYSKNGKKEHVLPFDRFTI